MVLGAAAGPESAPARSEIGGLGPQNPPDEAGAEIKFVIAGRAPLELWSVAVGKARPGWVAGVKHGPLPQPVTDVKRLPVSDPTTQRFGYRALLRPQRASCSSEFSPDHGLWVQGPKDDGSIANLNPRHDECFETTPSSPTSLVARNKTAAFWGQTAARIALPPPTSTSPKDSIVCFSLGSIIQ